MEESGRSFAKIEQSDLERLALLACEDREEFFARKPLWRRLYSDRVLCVALCQGAALQYADEKHGVKDFDVWTLYTRHPDAAFPCRRVGRKDFGRSKFGRSPDDVGYAGRRVDLLARSLSFASPTDPVQSIRTYLCAGRTKTARELARKAVILIEPRRLLGKIVWPKERAKRQ
jgi:hypothetical protein